MIVDSSKTTSVRDIPTDILKRTIDIRLPKMTQINNISIENDCYPNDLNLAEVRPVFKKKDASFISFVKGLRKNYVPTNRRFHEKQIIKSCNRL